jgi:hypothetical protein
MIQTAENRERLVTARDCGTSGSGVSLSGMSNLS